MNPIVRNVLAVITGLFIGSVVNGGIIAVSGSIIPPPEGADIKTMEGLKASMHLFKPENFLMPWLAHAMGTLVGAFLATLIAATHKMRFALTIGIVFLMGGIANVVMLPSPIWFTIADLAGAYLPMAWLGGKLALRK